MEYGTERVVALVDMDCFYVQVEQRINPELKNKPCVVAQYKTWKGGGIIAVSYEARAKGVTRNMWADDAKKLCPELQVARVRESHGKADLTCYREASVEVIEVMSRFAVVERASIDEAYMDLTASVKQRLKAMEEAHIDSSLFKSTYVEGYPQRDGCQDETEDVVLDKDAVRLEGLGQWLASLPPVSQVTNAELQLAVGAIIVEEMRAAVEQSTGFQCSAGISHNKVLAKLACGLHKPNRQTVLPLSSVASLFISLPLKKIRSLGGKMGASITETFKVENIGELTKFSQGQLAQHLGEKTGQWLYDLCRGIEFEAVRPRQLPKSIGCSKNFPGKTCLATRDQVQYWLHQLALELEERLTKDREMNGRVAKLLTVAIRMAGDVKPNHFSRCCALARYEASKIAADSYAIIKSLNNDREKNQAWSPPLTLLMLSASKFNDTPTASSGGITGFLSSEVGATQRSTSTTSSSSQAKQPSTTSKRPRIMESFFQSVSKRHKQGKAEVSCLETLDNDVEEHVESREVQVTECVGEKEGDTSESLEAEMTLFQEIKANEPDPVQTFPSTNNEGATILSHPIEDASECLTEETQCHRKPIGSVNNDDVDQEPFDPKLNSNFSAEDYLTCDRCGQEVLAWEMPEHTDFHFAQDLQESFSTRPLISQRTDNQSKMGIAPRSKPSSSSSNRNPSSSTPKPPTKKHKTVGSVVTLDSFFKRS